jgi:lysyl-tRNA synthetase class 2
MLDKVQEDRLKKLQAIRELGIDPYGHRYDTAEEMGPLRARFEKWETDNGGTEAAKAVQLKLRGDAAGRVMLFRDMGKMIFATIRDETGQVQIALRKRKPASTPDDKTAGREGGAAQGTVDDTSWKLAALLDLGDIIAIEGPMERTRTGEITIWAEKLTLLSKSLNPMPEKWHGLSDIQARYRQRYLDLASNPESMEVFKKRIAIIAHFRKVLQDKGFVEVETPMMQSVYGGAAARPFTTHHNALDMDLFMRISPELYLKRLLVGGMSKVFEINRNFRNEGIDTRHNPEFTMMELYQAYADYEVMMDITEELVSTAAERLVSPKAIFQAALKVAESINNEAMEVGQAFNKLPETLQTADFVAKTKTYLLSMVDETDRYIKLALASLAAAKTRDVTGNIVLPYGERQIDYTRPWPRKKYADLVKEYAGVDWKDEPAVRAKARELKIEDSNKDLAVVVNLIFEAVVEPELAKMNQPVFVIDYPAAICPLTRRKADDPSVALRFECFVAGMELANAYTELNDPAVQEENFRQQLRGEAANETMRVMDEDFVTALRHGMPPAGGLGIGIDRVIMLLTNRQSIRDVVLFPLLRTAE